MTDANPDTHHPSVLAEMTDSSALIACHDCDLLLRKPTLKTGQKASCPRCGAVLHQGKQDSLRRCLHLSLASLICFVLANAFPLLDFKLQGLTQRSEVITGVRELYRQGLWELAAVVLIVSILAPLLKIAGLLHVLLPLRFNRQPWGGILAFRFVSALHPWAMTEVYMLGILVAIVKLSDLATIVPGVALFSFAALIVCMAAADAALDPEVVWERLERAR